MNLELSHHVALVAGSSRGIGRAIATALLREGCNVCITGRNEDELERARKGLQSEFGQRVVSFAGDLTQTTSIREALDYVVRTWAPPDIVVANIGTGSGQPGWQNDDSEWQRLFDLNFFGSVRLIQNCVPLMQGRGGSILFIGTIAGLESTPAPLPYSAAKAALANYSKNLSRTLAAEKIRVNCLCPGNILFPGGSWERHLANRGSQVHDYISTEVPQQRFGNPDEIASFAAYLVSPVSAFATGGIYVMDGGQTRRY